MLDTLPKRIVMIDRDLRAAHARLDQDHAARVAELHTLALEARGWLARPENQPKPRRLRRKVWPPKPRDELIQQ